MNKRKQISKDLQVFFQSNEVTQWEKSLLKNNDLLMLKATIAFAIIPFGWFGYQDYVNSYHSFSFEVPFYIMAMGMFSIVLSFMTVTFCMIMYAYYHKFFNKNISKNFNEIKVLYESYMKQYPNELSLIQLSKYEDLIGFNDTIIKHNIDLYINPVIIGDELIYNENKWNESTKYIVEDFDEKNKKILIKNHNESKVINFHDIKTTGNNNGDYTITID